VGFLSNRAVRNGDRGLLLNFTNMAEADALGTCRKLERAIKEDLARKELFTAPHLRASPDLG
jgi:hypothetical protein